MVLCCVRCTDVVEAQPQEACTHLHAVAAQSQHGALQPRCRSDELSNRGRPAAAAATLANAPSGPSTPPHKHSRPFVAASGPGEVSLMHTSTSGASPLAVASTLATCTNTSNTSHVRPATDSTSGSQRPGSIPAAAIAAASGEGGPGEQGANTASRTAEALRRKRLIVDATKEQQKAWVERRLDALEDTLLLKRFVTLGPHERRNGGQAVVQFVREARGGRQFAIKFFLSQRAFEAERRVYSDSPLGRLLPQLEQVCDNRGGALRDAEGAALPPFVVMERGESLDEWSRHRKPDTSAAMPVVTAVAKRLYSMHIAGYAHRDLKPGNVMWLPREEQWTLIDFGFAAPLGSTAPMGFTLSYAAPEIIAAWLNQDTHIVATPAADAWALGVMVFELLTGRPAFDSVAHDREVAIAKLLGERALPWEALQPEDRERLGVFRAPVLELLRRDPSRRPSMASFYHTCRLLVDESAAGGR
eukprot:jgi/Ulvmu1/2344/UM013_0192.1